MRSALVRHLSRQRSLLINALPCETNVIYQSRNVYTSPPPRPPAPRALGPNHGNATSIACSCNISSRCISTSSAKYSLTVYSCHGSSMATVSQYNISKQSIQAMAACHTFSDGKEKEHIDKESILKSWRDNIDLDYLSEEQLAIHKVHIEAVEARQESYEDPFTAFHVISIIGHLNRGHCCGNACRHCPYQHAKAPAKFKNLVQFNTAFYG